MHFLKAIAISSVTVFISIAASINAHAAIYGGIEFPDGAISFADAVVSYTPGADVDVSGSYYDPQEALGTPDYIFPNANYPTGNGAVSLGDLGQLVVQFTDNALTTSGDATPDLHIFEVGGVIEVFNVAISTDGISWVDLGGVLGQPTSIDIDGVADVVNGALYSFVRLTDIPPNQTGLPWGEADIDAVGAISSVTTVPIPAAAWLFISAIGGLVAVKRKR